MIKKLRNMKKSVWLAICFAIGLTLAAGILIVGFRIGRQLENEKNMAGDETTVELMTSHIINQTKPSDTNSRENTIGSSVSEEESSNLKQEETTTSVYEKIGKDSTTVNWKDVNGNVYDEDSFFLESSKLPNEVFIKLRDGYGLLKSSIYRFIYTDKNLRGCTEAVYMKDSIKEKSNIVELVMQLNDKNKTKLKCSYNQETKKMKITKLK